MPYSRAASTQVVSHGSIGARPGTMPRARLLGEIVGAQHEAGEPRLGVGRGGGDLRAR